MATVPPHDPKAELSAIPTGPSNSLIAEYEAAIAAHKQHVIFMGPTRREYDALFLRHQQMQTHFEDLTANINSHRTAYQRHKKHVVALTNALLASNIALRSAPKPLSDFQALTQATLVRDLQLASNTLTDMMVQNKRLEKAKEISVQLDRGHHAQCREMFQVVEEDCQELDRLHAKVLEAEKQMDRKPECEQLDGNCFSCARNEEREARRAAVEKELTRASGKVSSRKGKAAQAKQRLDYILEEE